MNFLDDLFETLSSGVMVDYPGSTVLSNGRVSSILTSYDEYSVLAEVFKFDEDYLAEKHLAADVVGLLRFKSVIHGTFKESKASYRLLVDDFYKIHSVQVWTQREDNPRGYMSIGTSTEYLIFGVGGSLTQESVLSADYVFRTKALDLVNFTRANLDVKTWAPR